MEIEERDIPTIQDYDPELKRFSTQRTGQIILPAEWTKEKFETFLASANDACIYRKVSHNPIVREADSIEDLEFIAEAQRVVIDDVPYIDPFGLYVYIDTAVSWHSAYDVDLRFPKHIYEPLLSLEFEYLFI